MKIHVIFTGGTIGSQARPTTAALDVAEAAIPLLFSLFRKERANSHVEFSSTSLFSVLSENISLPSWEQLYNKVQELSQNDYDGIIITCGTDTLAYTSAFMAFMLDAALPVLMVSSDYPLGDVRANGVRNFIAAVDFIANVRCRGVFVPFGKMTAGKTTIHLGSRLQQALPFTHTFSSAGDVAFGQMDGYGNFQRLENKRNPTPEQLSIRPLTVPKFPSEKNILYLKAYPTMNYTILDFKEKPDAILHELFHSGTACVNPVYERHSIIPFVKRCLAQGIDLYAAPFEQGHLLYSTTKEMADNGVVFIANTHCAAAYVKLLIAYGSFSDKGERAAFIAENVAYEQIKT
ncbi:MAG: asparaginase [Defluviitaleaceae bacterium]|nr:asparaginase [Defluviitaleaceae bacterium]